MTDDEIIQKFKDDIANLGKKLPKNIRYLVGIFLEEGDDVYFGHGCPACAASRILDWIENEMPKHVNDEKESIN